LWDGFDLSPTARPPVATIHFKNRAALIGWARDPDLHFGETYMTGTVEITGDLVALLEAVYRALPARPRPWWSLWIDRNDTEAARENVHYHYDLGNEFYKLWLDSEMVYTCAYFPSPESTLEEAQVAKMDLVCRKLHLEPGDRVIEAGCGWGSLALFMAQHYGVTVRAFNISTEQIAYARDRAARMQLAGRVEFVQDDYRNASGACDAFVSVGMLEHVGLQQYQAFGDIIDRTLAASGRGLLHFIGRDQPAPLNPWIRKRIFPGAYPPTLREVFERIIEPPALSVLDVENLRLHYALTLAHWLRRFEDAVPRVASAFGDTFVRAWRLYLAGSHVAFTTGSMQLFQVVFTRRGNNAMPWLRASGLT
jgi:cyclopropane-fatty-acyl-phospholipid synthase